MKIGTRVLYVDSVGAEHPATATEIGERGPSGNRTVTLELDSGGTKKEVPHAADGKGTRTYWREVEPAPDPRPAEPVYPPTRGVGYVYGEGEPVPTPDEGDSTEDDGPGLGGGGGKDPGTPPPPPPAEPEGTPGDVQADAASTSRKGKK